MPGRLAAAAFAIAVGPGTVYPGLREDIRAARVCLTDAQLGSGHVAVWVGVSDAAGDWLQGGIGDVAGTDRSPYAYVESGHGWRQSMLRPVRQVALGDCVEVSLRARGRSWTVFLDGVPYARRTLAAGESAIATAENDAPRGANRFAFRIEPFA